MNSHDVAQGSQEWHQARCGKLTASCVHEAIAKTRTGWGASRSNLMARLIVERLTGIPQETYTNAAMEWGRVTETDARSAYSFYADVEVATVGFVDHPSLPMTGASPDGLVGDDGLVEFKCPTSATHLDTLLSRTVPSKYVTQMMWQMQCTGRQWCDFVSFDPRMPEHMRLFVKRLHRDEERIKELEKDVAEFLAEVEHKVNQLVSLYEREAA